MSMKKLYNIFIAILAIMGAVVAKELSQYLRNAGYDLEPFSMVLGILIILFMIVFVLNLIIINIIKKKRINTELMDTKLFEKKRLAEENYTKYFKSIRNLIFISTLYYIFINLLLFSIHFLMSFVTENDSVFVPVLFGLIFYFTATYLMSESQKVNFNNEIKESDYPKLWELVIRVSKKFKIKKKIRCFLIYENNAGVVETSKCCEIILGIELLYLLNEEELENVLIHEFAHVVLAHTSKTYKLNK